MTISISAIATDDLADSNLQLQPRRWDVSTFDWAYLQSSPHHSLNVEYQLLDVLLRGCNVEFAVEATDRLQAQVRFRHLYVGLMLAGVSPFFAPFTSTHSINDFSNVSAVPKISGPRSERARALREGTENVTIWWNEPGLSGMHSPLKADSSISSGVFRTAVELAGRWQSALAADPRAITLQETMISAPQIYNYGQSLLSIWTSLEGLFPKVNTEVSFRIGIYLAQLAQPASHRAYFERLRKAYGVRSAFAHGSARVRSQPISVQRENWSDAWDLLCDATRAVIERGKIPSEDSLTSELFPD